MSELSPLKVREILSGSWADDGGGVLASLSGLVEIPALSPGFDASWQASGHLEAAAAHVRDWIAGRGLPGAQLEIVRLPGRSPVLIADVPATPGAADRGTVLLYGHLDKQPPFEGWSAGLGPWQAVRRDGRLYGRGVVDDGYAGYAAVTALEAARGAGGSHARAVVLLETGEESGSPDLPAYLEHLAGRLGDVTLVVCLDGGGGDYSRLWLTTSLRGIVQATVTVRVLRAPQHSGLASGIVPSSFRILRQLLDRLEDSGTGEVRLPAMNVPIPEAARAAALVSAAAAPGSVRSLYPLADGMRPASDDEAELILNNTWRPTLAVIGAAGLPAPADAGNVLRAATTLTLSFRTPPTVDSRAALAELEHALTTDVPYGAQVEISDPKAENGWTAPESAPWLAAALDEVGGQVFGERHGSIGIGGSIPFMELLGRRYPRAQFVVTGALGTDSNMHVPDEWLNIGFARQVTEAVAHVLDAHARS
jgi:acetylornithine deacetylase/succinyl-diaminopimelate desuccinylase-like protein